MYVEVNCFLISDQILKNQVLLFRYFKVMLFVHYCAKLFFVSHLFIFDRIFQLNSEKCHEKGGK